MYRKITRLNRVALLASGGVASFGLNSCDFTEFTTTVTLDSRSVVEFLVRGAILTPLEDAINQGIDYVFDKIDNDENR